MLARTYASMGRAVGRSMAMARVGICHICGASGPLTFEHVPPQKAFNNKPVIVLPFDASHLGPDPLAHGAKGRVQQRGLGDYTLCARCNSVTGSWYGGDFVDWCYQGAVIL